MAQTVSILTISNDECKAIGITENTPTNDDVEEMAIECEMFGDIEAEFISYNIGTGESYTDCFFDMEELKRMCATGDFEMEVEIRGLPISWFQTGNLYATVEE